MPPKGKKAEPGKKTVEKQKEKIIEVIRVTGIHIGNIVQLM